MFIKIKHSRTFEDIILQIQEPILEGRLKAGDKLPSERKLQELFQVSRNTLREALRVLEQKGLITIKTGNKGGAIVSQVDMKGVSESLALLLKYQKISLNELTEFREKVEGLVAEKAAQIATSEDVEKLKKMVKSIKYHLQFGKHGWDEISKLDTEFHLSLAQIAGNRMFESVLFTVHDNINQYFHRFLSKDQMTFKNTYKELCRITEAIEKRDPNKAKTFLKQHLRRYSRMMEKKAKTTKGTQQKGRNL